MKLARPLIVAVLTLAVVVSPPVAVAATNGTGLQQETAATAAAQDPAAVEASLGLDRPPRRLIQQGLRNEGVDPGTPDGLFGPRTRAAIQDWQQSRGASPTGYLNRAEAELFRTAAAPPPAVSEASPPPEAAPNVDASALSDAATPASTAAETDSNPAPAHRRHRSRPAERRRDERRPAVACRNRLGERPAASRDHGRPASRPRRTAPRRRRPRRRPRGDERDSRAFLGSPETVSPPPLRPPPPCPRKDQ